MGYDLHITRAESWSEAAANPISETDWLEAVSQDPSLRVSNVDYWFGLPDIGSAGPCFVARGPLISVFNYLPRLSDLRLKLSFLV